MPHVSRRQFLKSASAGMAISSGLASLGGAARAFAQSVEQGAVPQIDMIDMSFDLLDQPDWTFLLLTDTHITHTPPPFKTENAFGTSAKKNSQQNIPRLLKVIEQANALRPDFAIHLGDMVTSHPQRPFYEGEVKNTLLLRDRFDCPVHFCPGNHDIGNKMSLHIPKWPKNAGDPKICFHATPDNIAIYEEAFGKSYYSFNHKNAHFISLNDHVFNNGTDFEKRQWEWLEKDIKNAAKTDRMIFVASHTPLYWVDPVLDIGAENYEVIDNAPRARILAMLKKYNVKAVFTGHTHQPILNRYGNTLLVTSTSTAFARNTWNLYPDQGGGHRTQARSGYSLVRVYGDEFIVNYLRIVDTLPEAKTIGGFQPRRLVTRMSSECAPETLALTADPARFAPRKSSALCLIGGVDPSAYSKKQKTLSWRSEREESHRIEIRLPGGRRVQKVELVTTHGNPPQRVTIEASRHGKTMRRIFEGERPEGDAETMACSFDTFDASLVRIEMKGAHGEEDPTSWIGLSQIRILDENRVNVATHDRGAKIEASSTQSNRPQGYTTDNNWMSAFDIGAPIVRIDPDRMAPGKFRALDNASTIDPEPIKAADYAASYGSTVMIPVVMPAEATPEDWQYIATYLSSRFKKGARLWEIPDDQATPQILRAFRKGLKHKKDRIVISGIALSEWSAGKVELPEGADGVAVTANCEDAELGKHLKDAAQPDTFAMVLFEDAEEMDPVAVVRAYIACRAHGIVPNFDLRPARGLLNRNDDPTPAYYALRSAQTALGRQFDSIKTRKNEIRFDANGETTIAFWEKEIQVGPRNHPTVLIDPSAASIVTLSTSRSKPLDIAAGPMPQFLSPDS